MKLKILLNSKKICYIFGESHFHQDEVNGIREKIIKIKPDIILHELYYEDKQFFKKYNLKVIPLEDQPLDNEPFRDREIEMLKNIKKALRKYDSICVVVGDTHLRTIQTPELGKRSVIQAWASNKKNVKIIRSKYREIQ